MSISLNDIKLAVFNFDGVLAIHEDKNYVEHRQGDLDSYFLSAFEHPVWFYETIEPCKAPDEMIGLVGYCRFEKIPMMCISDSAFSLHIPAMKHFIRDHYGDVMEVVVAERKTDAIRIFMKHHGVTPEHVLVVDDLWGTRDALKKDLFQYVAPGCVSDLVTKYGSTLFAYMGD